MTARADRLTHGARTPDNAGVVRSSYPASSLRVFVGALERLDYRMAPLLAEAGIHRADLALATACCIASNETQTPECARR
jgi:hypothetical protein